jgi:hypothetical protein
MRTPERQTGEDVSLTLEDGRAIVVGVASDTERSAWLAALLTAFSRFAFPGPPPLFLTSANTPGTSKGLLLDGIATLLTDRHMNLSAGAKVGPR